MLQPRTPKAPIALLYDAARKALTAILENQGLRPTSRGQLRAAAGAAGQPRRRPVRRRWLLRGSRRRSPGPRQADVDIAGMPPQALRAYELFSSAELTW